MHSRFYRCAIQKSPSFLGHPPVRNLKTQRDRREDDAVRDKTEITSKIPRDRVLAGYRCQTTKTVVLESELFVQEVPDPKAHDTELLRQTIAESGVDHHEVIAAVSPPGASDRVISARALARVLNVHSLEERDEPLPTVRATAQLL